MIARVRPQLSYANVMATVAVFLALGGASIAATGGIGSGGKIAACYKKVNGQLRVVKTGAKCRKGEKTLSWSQTGPTGDTGAAGAAGSDASVNGVAAGGDLTGTFPNPTIADDAVGTSEFAVLPGAVVSRGSDQSIPNNTATDLSFSIESFDSLGMHPPADTEFNIATSGAYLITAYVSWDANATGQRSLTITRNSSVDLATDLKDAAAAGVTRHSVSVVARLTAGDFIEAEVFQNSGGALNVDQTTGGPSFSIYWLGPTS